MSEGVGVSRVPYFHRRISRSYVPFYLSRPSVLSFAPPITRSPLSTAHTWPGVQTPARGYYARPRRIEPIRRSRVDGRLSVNQPKRRSVHLPRINKTVQTAWNKSESGPAPAQPLVPHPPKNKLRDPQRGSLKRHLRPEERDINVSPHKMSFSMHVRRGGVESITALGEKQKSCVASGRPRNTNHYDDPLEKKSCFINV